MPDLGPAVVALLDVLGPVLRPALKALLRTVAGMAVLAAGCTGLAVWFSWQHSMGCGLTTAACCLALSVVTTGALATKNAVLRGLLEGVRGLGLGAKMMNALFGSLGVTESSPHGERGGLGLRAAEKVPLREAEARLRKAAQSLLHGRSIQGGLRGWLSKKLLTATVERVERYSLARLRADASAHGGIDLLKLQAELASTIDDGLARQLEVQAQRITLLVGGGYVLLEAVIAVVVIEAFKR